MSVTSDQIRAARALLRWEQKDLAAASGISLPAIKRLETIPGPLAAQGRTIDALKAALQAAGVEFTNGGHPGVRMKVVLVHTEHDSDRLLFAIKGSEFPPGKWDGGRPMAKLPLSVRLNERGWFVYEEPTEEDRRRARRWYQTSDKS